eukprot:403347177
MHFNLLTPSLKYIPDEIQTDSKNYQYQRNDIFVKFQNAVVRCLIEDKNKHW